MHIIANILHIKPEITADFNSQNINIIQYDIIAINFIHIVEIQSLI